MNKSLKVVKKLTKVFETGLEPSKLLDDWHKSKKIIEKQKIEILKLKERGADEV